jgi:hypothetical protein
MKYKWEDFNNSEVTRFCRDYKLQQITQSAETEFEKQMSIKTWCHNVLKNGTPSRDYSDLTSREILEDAQEGKEFWCTQYSLLFLQVGVALGFYTRRLGVDSQDKQKDMHHGVCDIWTDEFKKWYIVDAQNNIHYEKDGVPLNALEIRNEYIKNKASNVVGILGNHKEQVHFDENSYGYSTPSNYYWFFISLRNNFFEEPGIYNTKALLWEDDYNKDEIWYRGGGKNDEISPHPMYESQFVRTSKELDLYPEMVIR